MKLYLSGPMTGYPDLNFPAFNAEAERLRALGYEIVNPVDINGDLGADWKDCIKVDIDYVAECDGVAVIPGWEASSGAQIEVWTARHYKLPVIVASSITEPWTWTASRGWALL